jgi:hypothetical protein
MEIQKEGAVLRTGTPDPRQLEAINELARGRVDEDAVYAFSVRLCDDQIDRDYERFSTEALHKLAPMFVGKTGIVDHDWSADRQVARIFDCHCEVENGATFLRAWAYMLRSDRTRDTIAEIEAGIKKEVSVGCAMGSATCSICGAAYGTCEHRKGETYAGEVCCAVLADPIDAYEFSFVAVPAQPRAGVIKSWNGAGGGASDTFRALEADAALGRIYLGELRNDVTRLGLLVELGLSEPQLRALADRMTAEELRAVREALTEKSAERFPVATQLRAKGEKTETVADFLV